MAFGDAFIQELKQRNDVEEVISQYVRLKNNGRTLVGLCPFHNEKTPSFVVYPQTQSFYCFGCGAGGEIITFIKKMENLDYVDAVKFLADRVGMSLPQDGVDDSLHRQRKRILEANRQAARFFHSMLQAEGGEVAREYLQNRGIAPPTVRKYGLGFAPNDWHALHHHMNRLGFSDQELDLANLLRRRDTGYYDAFRNKLMFPIIDIRGNVIAFGGRVLDDSKPKYINTSDTLVYKKSEGVFSLNLAKNDNEGRIVVVEGYMDVIALYQAGIRNVVACLGTALTVQQARLLSRYAKEIVLAYDADEAGRKATDRAIGIFNSQSIGVRVARLSGGKDPDEIVKKLGVERLRRMLEGADNDIEYQLLKQRELVDMTTDSGKIAFLNAAASILAEAKSPVEQEVYASRLAEELNLDKSVLMLQIQKAVKSGRRRETKKLFENIQKEISGRNDPLNPEKARYLRGAKAEERLISLLMYNPDFLAHIEKKLTKESFLTSFHARLYQLLSERIHEGRPVELSYLSETLTSQEISYLANLQSHMGDMQNALEECMACADTILEEKRKQSLQKPQEMDAQSWQEAMKALGEEKKK